MYLSDIFSSLGVGGDRKDDRSIIYFFHKCLQVFFRIQCSCLLKSNSRTTFENEVFKSQKNKIRTFFFFLIYIFLGGRVGLWGGSYWRGVTELLFL